MTMWLKAYFKKTARFLLRMCCLLLGNSFEPRPNSCALGAFIFSSSHKNTQGGSVKFAECGCPVSSLDKRIAALREISLTLKSTIPSSGTPRNLRVCGNALYLRLWR